METLGVLDVDSLDVAVKLLLSTLLVVSSAGNADAQSVGNTLDTLLPDLLVQLGVDADISGTLNNPPLAIVSCSRLSIISSATALGPCCGLWCRRGRIRRRSFGKVRTMALAVKALISRIARGALFLKVTPCN